MYTIGQLGKHFGLSRSTLLYYDKISLLTPSGRSDANYRIYTQADFDRMSMISVYRDAGLALDVIGELLAAKGGETTRILERRLNKLNIEISEKRQQQQLIVQLLGRDSLLRSSRVMNKEQWVSILRASGMDDEAMRQWHIEFERDLPEVHRDFLESIGIEAPEIEAIKAWSKEGRLI